MVENARKTADKINANSFGDFSDEFENNTWYQHLTQSETNLEVNNSILIELTHEICDGEPTLQGKIKEILKWLKDNIDFASTWESQGAYKTYQRKKGDCSDYASIFTTMIRILKIPTRKVLGFSIIPAVGSKFHPPREGDCFNYSGSKYGARSLSISIPGHAWAEYYHPRYGFITLDPVFACSNPLKYMNYIGYHYFIVSLGENFYEGIELQLAAPASEWNLIPHLEIENNLAIRWNFSLKVEVLETEGK
ncbi:MAG: transglutaminase-like domain-containing protein [Promethearchaeota archaeon]